MEGSGCHWYNLANTAGVKHEQQSHIQQRHRLLTRLARGIGPCLEHRLPQVSSRLRQR
jgi:hypothetical protein